MSGTYLHPVRVYFEDTDFSGNVYHAAYLKFCERGRTEMLRAAGVHHGALLSQGIVFAVRRMEIEFIAPAKIDDLLSVSTQVETMTGARLVLVQEVRRDDAVLATARVVVVAVGAETGRALRLPGDLRAALA